MRAMMLTELPTAETSKKARELGADDYCGKPIEVYELEEKVATILAQT
jgi:DNA-binding response OmpR family regulator